jgi:hypothetical protein
MRQQIPGWARIGENQFKAVIATAMKTDPDLCMRLRYAVEATSARRGVRQEVRDRYLGWLGEVEAAMVAIAEAEQEQAQLLEIMSVKSAVRARTTSTRSQIIMNLDDAPEGSCP